MLDEARERLLRERIAAFALLEPYADTIAAVARIGIRLRVTDEAARDDETRFGGTASLPEEVEWPLCREERQPVVAQIILRDVKPFDAEDLLPPDGRLLFFHTAPQYQKPGASAVLYVPEGVPLVPRRAPAYRARRAVATPEISLPHPDALRPDLAGEASYAYQELIDTFYPEGETVSMLLGYQRPIHNPWVDELAHEERWRLLLQVDSEEKAGMMWGDCGRICYWLREADLRARRFETIELDSQCY